MLVTADHGNAERMIDEAGKPVTKHTTFRGEQSLDFPSWDHLFLTLLFVLGGGGGAYFWHIMEYDFGIVTLVRGD